MTTPAQPQPVPITREQLQAQITQCVAQATRAIGVLDQLAQSLEMNLFAQIDANARLEAELVELRGPAETEFDTEPPVPVRAKKPAAS